MEVSHDDRRRLSVSSKCLVRLPMSRHAIIMIIVLLVRRSCETCRAVTQHTAIGSLPQGGWPADNVSAPVERPHRIRKPLDVSAITPALPIGSEPD